jgi:hypothetical protein
MMPTATIGRQMPIKGFVVAQVDRELLSTSPGALKPSSYTRYISDIPDATMAKRRTSWALRRGHCCAGVGRRSWRPSAGLSAAKREINFEGVVRL